jgi:hypothetical protein
MQEMLVDDPLNDFVFSDPGRLLQQMSNSTTSVASDTEISLDAVLLLRGAQMLPVLFWCVSVCRCIVNEKRERANAMAAPSSELPHHGGRPHKTPNADTLSEPKQALLELFEKAQTMMASVNHTVMARHQNEQFTQMRKLTLS